MKKRNYTPTVWMHTDGETMLFAYKILSGENWVLEFGKRGHDRLFFNGDYSTSRMHTYIRFRGYVKLS